MSEVVVGIIRGREGYAFLQKTDGAWTFPSGKVEQNESLNDAIIREVEEETGLIVAPIFNLGSRIVKGDVVFYKICQYQGGELHLKEPGKFLSAQWMSAQDILKTTDEHLFAPVKQYLEEHVPRGVHAAPITKEMT